MPKKLLERCNPDSVCEFRAAADQRFRDALSLATSGRRTAAIYLWGYAAEMTLKAAYFGAIGFPPMQPITKADLRAAEIRASLWGVAWPKNRFHDLNAWAELLVATRAATPRLAYGFAGFDNEVLSKSRRVHRHWSEVLRYHKNVAYPYEMDHVRDATEWLLVHSLKL